MTSSASISLNHSLFSVSVKSILSLLNGRNEEARIVGGAVRRALLNREARDVDFVTTASPEAVIRRLRCGGFSTFRRQPRYPTVSARIGTQTYDITTCRSDTHHDGRHAQTSLHRSWKMDSWRRDFTVNAIYVCPDGRIWDPHNGIGDLHAGRVRFIGDPASRIREDYLRILRYFRVAADLGFVHFSSEVLQLLANNRHNLDRISADRKRDELLALMSAKNPLPSAAAMVSSGILSQITGTSTNLQFLSECVESAGRRRSVEPFRDPFFRLIASMCRSGSDPAILSDRLNLSTRQQVLAKSAWSGNPEIMPNRGSIRCNLFQIGRRAALWRLGIQYLKRRNHCDWDLFSRAFEQEKMPVFPIRSSELSDSGIPPGPEMGKVMRSFRRAWIAAGCPEHSTELHSRVKRILASRTHT